MALTLSVPTSSGLPKTVESIVVFLEKHHIKDYEIKSHPNEFMPRYLLPMIPKDMKIECGPSSVYVTLQGQGVLSIQTHPSVTRGRLAETLPDGMYERDSQFFGYDDIHNQCLRWDDVGLLCEHILKMYLWAKHRYTNSTHNTTVNLLVKIEKKLEEFKEWMDMKSDLESIIEGQIQTMYDEAIKIDTQ